MGISDKRLPQGGGVISLNAIFLISILLKGFGAALEVLIQLMITRLIGVDGYGSFSTVINTADLLFWVFFSGLVKCNTFYLSQKGMSIASFKRKYYVRYVIPCLAFVMMLLVGADVPMAFWVCGICLAELLVMDLSSSLLARGAYILALVGEYIFGRSILLTSLLVFKGLSIVSVHYLVLIYLLQFLATEVLFLSAGKWGYSTIGSPLRTEITDIENSLVPAISELEAGVKRSSEIFKDISDQVSVQKWGIYQWSDILQSMIVQMPIILQFLLGGAFEAGVVSIVLLAKKLINFISGPTAKVFLPLFSRLYKEGKKEEIRERFASIMCIQMVFVAPMSVALLGFPQVLLRLFAKELVVYTGQFRLCAGVFLVAASLGPNSGVLQMTENEKKDICCREFAIACMVLTLFLLHTNSLFVLYGLCVHMAVEELLKFRLVCKWMGGMPVNPFLYAGWWIIPVCLILGAVLAGANDSLLWMLAFAGFCFLIFIYKERRLLNSIKNGEKS